MILVSQFPYRNFALLQLEYFDDYFEVMFGIQKEYEVSDSVTLRNTYNFQGCSSGTRVLSIYCGFVIILFNEISTSYGLIWNCFCILNLQEKEELRWQSSSCCQNNIN